MTVHWRLRFLFTCASGCAPWETVGQKCDIRHFGKSDLSPRERLQAGHFEIQLFDFLPTTSGDSAPASSKLAQAMLRDRGCVPAPLPARRAPLRAPRPRGRRQGIRPVRSSSGPPACRPPDRRSRFGESGRPRTARRSSPAHRPPHTSAANALPTCRGSPSRQLPPPLLGSKR